MGELHWYIHQDPPPSDFQSTSETLAYLEACNLLFEERFLSRTNKIFDAVYGSWILSLLLFTHDNSYNTQRIQVLYACMHGAWL